MQSYNTIEENTGYMTLGLAVTFEIHRRKKRITWALLKLETSAQCKTLLREWRQAADREKIFANHIWKKISVYNI